MLPLFGQSNSSCPPFRVPLVCPPVAPSVRPAVENRNRMHGTLVLLDRYRACLDTG